MNFENSILPLSEYLLSLDFSITRKTHNYIAYFKSPITLTVAYSNLECVFYTHIGNDPNELFELTPLLAFEVYGDENYKFHSTLTIDNLISFLKTTGHSILAPDNNSLNKAKIFSENLAKETTQKILHLKNLQNADKAWKEKDFDGFIRLLDKCDKDQLTEAYLKKYQIASSKMKNNSA